MFAHEMTLAVLAIIAVALTVHLSSVAVLSYQSSARIMKAAYMGAPDFRKGLSVGTVPTLSLAVSVLACVVGVSTVANAQPIVHAPKCHNVLVDYTVDTADGSFSGSEFITVCR